MQRVAISSPNVAVERERSGLAMAPRRIRHLLSVDVDDWPVAVLGPQVELTDRVVTNTRRMLGIFRDHGVRGTFFVLGRIAEAFPALVREIAGAGHEIASHGYSHQLVTRQSPGQFRADVLRGLDVLEAITGSRPVGYRAPAFSIVASTRWAGPILSELGIRYSSSVFPFRGRRYGIADAQRGIHRWDGCDLVEVPPSTIEAAGRRWPVGGGGYFRLMPGIATEMAVRRLEREGLPAVFYFHPYELDAREMSELRRGGWEIPRRVSVMQSLFRRRVEARLRRLLQSFAMSPFGESVGLV